MVKGGRKPLSYDERVANLWLHIKKGPHVSVQEGDITRDCWLCTFKPSKGGYCYVKWTDGRLRVVHHVVYEVLTGKPIPPELLVNEWHHACDTKSCCNPVHVYPVTATENAQARSDSNARSRDRVLSYIDKGLSKELGRLSLS